MYGTQGNIGTIVTAGTDNAPVPDIPCAGSGHFPGLEDEKVCRLFGYV